MRQFGNDIKNYKNKIAPVLELMVASPSIMSLQLIKYIIGINSETELYEILSEIEHIISLKDDQGGVSSNITLSAIAIILFIFGHICR